MTLSIALNFVEAPDEAAVLAEEPEAIEEIYEPYLIQIGFLNRTPRGRVVTPAAYKHLELDWRGNENDQQTSLFK